MVVVYYECVSKGVELLVLCRSELLDHCHHLLIYLLHSCMCFAILLNIYWNMMISTYSYFLCFLVNLFAKLMHWSK
ncbi:hypothetical protein Hanom_Chr03g00219441 [Helianthus anomalus]